MKCRIKEDQLSAWLLGHLSAVEAETMKKHVVQCAGCTRTVVELKMSMQVLANKTNPVLPLGFQERVLARAKELQQPQKRWGWQKGLVSIAAALLLGFGVMSFWPESSVNQQGLQSYTEDFNTIGYFADQTNQSNMTDGLFGVPSELMAYLNQ